MLVKVIRKKYILRIVIRFRNIMLIVNVLFFCMAWEVVG